MAIPFLPKSFTDRMSTIENHQADQSASTRIAVWKWTWDYVQDHPFGGGFDAYRGNKIRYQTKAAETSVSSTEVQATYVEDASRAYHSSYFEMLGEQGFPGIALWLWLQLLGCHCCLLWLWLLLLSLRPLKLLHQLLVAIRSRRCHCCRGHGCSSVWLLLLLLLLHVGLTAAPAAAS